METIRIIGDAAQDSDATLVHNISRALRFSDLVASGRTVAETSDVESVSRSRVQQLSELAFLAANEAAFGSSFCSSFGLNLTVCAFAHDQPVEDGKRGIDC